MKFLPATARISLEPVSGGLINSSWRVLSGVGNYLLQALNPAVFPDPDRVMDNIRRVTAHMATKPGESLYLLPTRSGDDFHRDPQGLLWRLYPFIDGVTLRSGTARTTELRDGARLFGRFVADLVDLPGPPLNETIAGFHATPRRIDVLKAAIETDPLGRAADCQREIDAVLSRQPLSQVLAELDLPSRIVHNDTKLDNVLFDTDTRAARCVLDLDTLMPGLVAHDFGDLVRSASQDGFFVDRYEAMRDGYVEGIGQQLSERELASLPIGPPVITLELAARFLTDYLQGDRYFRCSYPAQNIARCQKQLNLLASLETYLGPQSHASE